MAKYAAKGILVKTGSAATPTTNLPNVRSVTLNLGSRELINAATHDSTSVKDHIAAPLRDSASVEIEILLDPGHVNHDELIDAHLAGTKWYFTVVFPDAGAAQVAMGGYITDISTGALDPESGLLAATISYKADSLETYTQ